MNSWDSHTKMRSIIIITIGLIFSIIQPIGSATVSSSITSVSTKASSTTPQSTGTSSSITGSTSSTTMTTSSSTSTMSPTTSSYVTSTYSNVLTTSSPRFVRPNGTSGSTYYYQAIQVTIYTTATYTFRSNATGQLDLYGCLYEFSFDPYNPGRNLVVCDDDSGGGYQFLISRFLQYGGTYILVVTTYRNSDTGYYTISAVGPDAVHMSSIAPPSSTTTPLSSTTTPPSSTTTTPSSTTTTPTPSFSGTLSFSSPTFIRPSGGSSLYYYQAIQTTTYTSGTYTLRSTSRTGLDTYGCLYSTSFDPTYPSENLLTCNDDSGGSGQFLINYYLSSGQTYILVVTTYSSLATGSYSILAMGPGYVSMTAITPTPTPTFSGTLSSSSPTFSRPYGASYLSYYYQAIQTRTYTAGTYTLRSTSRTGMDTYGCLYSTSFDPTYPYRNLLTCDDDSGGSGQFLVSHYLLSGQTYVLVVTTSSSRTTGSYSIIASGPGSLSMIAISPSGSHPLTVGQIVGIVFGCFIVLVIISIVCGCRNRRRVPPQQRLITVPSNSNAYQQNVYSPHPQTNPRVYADGAPYTVPVTNAVPPTMREENPPSYQAYVATAKQQP
jgi:hypothetical protein